MFRAMLKCAAYCLFLLLFCLPVLAGDDETSVPFIYGGLAWSPDGGTIAVATSDGIWLHSSADLSIIEQLAEIPFVTTMDWHPDGQTIASEGIEDQVVILDVQTKEIALTLPVDRGVWTLKWSPDGELLASVDSTNILRVWDGTTGEELLSIEIDTETTILYSITWNPGSNRVALKQQGNLTIWDVTTGEELISWFHNIETYSTKWSPDGELLASGGWDGIVYLWDVETGELVETLDIHSSIHTLTWSPDSERLAVQIGQTRDRERLEVIQIWNVVSGEKRSEIRDVYMGGVGHYDNALAWSPDGERLAATSDDGKVYVWDSETYETLAVYDGYRDMLLSP